MTDGAWSDKTLDDTIEEAKIGITDGDGERVGAIPCGKRLAAARLSADCALVVLTGPASNTLRAEAGVKDRVDAATSEAESRVAAARDGCWSVCRLPRMTYSQVQNMKRGRREPAMIAVRTCESHVIEHGFKSLAHTGDGLDLHWYAGIGGMYQQEEPPHK